MQRFSSCTRGPRAFLVHQPVRMQGSQSHNSIAPRDFLIQPPASAFLPLASYLIASNWKGPQRSLYADTLQAGVRLPHLPAASGQSSCRAETPPCRFETFFGSNQTSDFYFQTSDFQNQISDFSNPRAGEPRFHEARSVIAIVQRKNAELCILNTQHIHRWTTVALVLAAEGSPC